MNKIIKKIAGIFCNWKSASFILMTLLLAAACKEEPIGQQPVHGNRPNPIRNVTAISRPGGAYIFYRLPDDRTDISYVKGVFEIDGEERTVRASVYNNYLTIDGLDSHLYVEIDLYVVDHSENLSEPLSTKFITFDAPYTTMGNSIQLAASVGGVGVRWESPNAEIQYYASIGMISSNYDSDVGVVLMVADDDGKMTELAVSFSTRCSFIQPVLDSATRLYAAYAMDKWGHYSDTVYAMLKPTFEQWLNRRLMKPYYIGNDNRTLTDNNPSATYYSGMPRLFDSMTYCLQPNTPSIHSTNVYQTSYLDTATGAEWLKPFYFTMDLGTTADISRFWISPGTHSRDDRFWEYSNGSLYDFELWGTETDFGEGSPDYKPIGDPYWSDNESLDSWRLDKRWKYMGRYLNKRHNVPGDTPWNLSSEPPEEVPVQGGGSKIGEDPAWDESKRVRGNGNGYRYLADGSGPVRNNGFYTPDAGWHFAINQVAVGPVRYVRWQINEVWSQVGYVRFSELWYWGGIVSDND
jgi:hypothetical protein